MGKKAQSLAILMVLVILAAVVFSFGSRPVRESCHAAEYGGKVARHNSLRMLAESTAPSQTENNTSLVDSGGAIEASFTVVTGPGSEPVAGWAAPTAVDEGDSSGDPTVVPGHKENGAAGGRSMGDGHSTTAAGVNARSGGLTRGWAVLTGVWAVADVALIAVAIWYGRPGRRSRRFDELGDHSA